MKRSLLERLKKWWEGRYVPPDDSHRFILYIGHYERPPIVLALEAVGRWLKEHYWKVLTLLVSLLALYVHSRKGLLRLAHDRRAPAH